jgi:hypothetical protein
VCLVVPAWAMRIAPAPIGSRVATADCVVVGKVVSIEEKPVKAARFPGDKEMGDYLVASVKIENALVGAKGLTHVKVGFLPPPAPGTGRPIIRPGGGGMPQLKEGQEVCLFLTEHADGAFYTAPAYFSVIDKKDNPNFEKDVAEVKRCAKLLDNPKEALKSKNADDRFLTAALLLQKYRSQRQGAGKQEQIDAEESKQILHAIADADWKKQVVGFQLTPLTAFYSLGLTPDDGWKPMNGTQIPEAAKEWLTKNADTYRIKRFVVEKAGKEEKKP